MKSGYQIRPPPLEKEKTCLACHYFKKFKCQKYNEEIKNPLMTTKCRRAK